MTKRPYEFRDNVQIAVNWEFNLDLVWIERQSYSILDWMSDVGGITEAFFFLGTVWLAFARFGQAKFNLVQALFLSRPGPGEDKGGGGGPQELKPIPSLKLMAQRFFPKCIKKNRNERLFKKGWNNLLEEIDIVDFLKKFREVKAGLKQMKQNDKLGYNVKEVQMPILSCGEVNDNKDTKDLETPMKSLEMKRWQSEQLDNTPYTSKGTIEPMIDGGVHFENTPTSARIPRQQRVTDNPVIGLVDPVRR